MLPLVVLLPLARNVPGGRAAGERDRALIGYAREIHDRTVPQSVGMVPANSMVIVYYARRHVIRGVSGDTAVDRVADRVSAVFPGSPVYLAVPAGEREGFARSMARYPVVSRSERLVLLRVNASRENAMGGTGSGR